MEVERKDGEFAEIMRRLDVSHAHELQTYAEQVQELEASRNVLRQQLEQARVEMGDASREAVQELQQSFDTYKRQSELDKAMLEDELIRSLQEVDLVSYSFTNNRTHKT